MCELGSLFLWNLGFGRSAVLTLCPMHTKAGSDLQVFSDRGRRQEDRCFQALVAEVSD